MPLHLLHIDSSARPGRAGEHPHGSQTRRLTHRFVSRWCDARPGDTVHYRDVGAEPPLPVSHAWVGAAFTPAGEHAPWMLGALDESDILVDELLRADVLVIGAPLYNFGPPAPLKAWIDNVVRAGRTVAIDTARPDDPYRPLLADRPRTAIVLSSRGGFGYGPGEPMAGMNHLEPSLRTALAFIGITDVREAVIEHEEHKDTQEFERSVTTALQDVDAIVDTLLAHRRMQTTVAQTA